MAKKKKNKKSAEVPVLTQADIEECLRRGAKNANELDKTLKQVFRLTSAQWNMRLD